MNNNIMEKELAHSFNIVLNDDFLKEILEIQKRLKEKITERRNYDSSPHLAIATKFMDESKTDDFVKILIKEFSNDKKQELIFSSLSISKDKDYIFLNPNEKSKEIISSLHKRAFITTKDIGFENHNGLSLKYLYNPHISIIKLQPEQIPLAMEIIGNDFSDFALRMESYEITRQKDRESGFSDFPIIQKINLK
jgi:hypothetical protein